MIEIDIKEVYKSLSSEEKFSLVNIYLEEGVSFEELSNELRDFILSSRGYSYRLIKEQNYKLSEVPYGVIQKVSEDSWYSFYLIEILIEEQKYKLSDIPYELTESVSKDSEWSYYLIRFLIGIYNYKLSEVPYELIQSVSRNDKSSYFLIEFLIEKQNYKLLEIPKELRYREVM